MLSLSTKVTRFTSFFFTVPTPSLHFFRLGSSLLKLICLIRASTFFFQEAFHASIFFPSNDFKIKCLLLDVTFLCLHNVSVSSDRYCLYHSFNRYSNTQHLHYFCFLSALTLHIDVIIAASVFLSNFTFVSLKHHVSLQIVLMILHKSYPLFILNENLKYKNSPHSQNLIHLIYAFAITVISDLQLALHSF